MENPLSSDENTVKSRITRAVLGAPIIIVISMLIPAVFLKSGAFFRPSMLAFLQRWLSPPYIYLVLLVVIILIVASPSLLYSILCVFNYFKEGKSVNGNAISNRVEDASKLSPPPLSLVAETTTRTTSSDSQFFQDWLDFMQDQTPTYFSPPPLERESFDKPWPDTKKVDSSVEALESLDGREREVEDKNFAKLVKQRGEPIVKKIKNTHELIEDDSLESAWKAIEGRGDVVSSLSLNDNKYKSLRDLNSDDTFEGTWKTIIEGVDKISSPSLIRSKGDEASTIGIEESNDTCEFNEDETLDATWKAIMEKGESTVSRPSSLNFNESEWANVPSRLISRRVSRQDALATWQEISKLETFNETMSARQRAGLRRDPSTSLDDLNCRFESFIKNFNRQMWLQRQESERRVLEMINSGG